VELPDTGQAVAIFEPLHANIYRAFDYVQPSEIYDALERSVDGALLDALYNDIYRGLILQEEGGALSRVQRVDSLGVEVESIGLLADGRPGFTLQHHWRVTGAVFHWGHSHYRTNEYRARYTVAAGGPESGGGWRIRGHQPLEQVRLEVPILPDEPEPGTGGR
jgi:hypothetical protein